MLKACDFPLGTDNVCRQASVYIFKAKLKLYSIILLSLKYMHAHKKFGQKAPSVRENSVLLLNMKNNLACIGNVLLVCLIKITS